ncbi:MAG: hypothetical protein ABI779_01905 [Acidobacteriota bacterium]
MTSTKASRRFAHDLVDLLFAHVVYERVTMMNPQTTEADVDAMLDALRVL